MNTVKKLLLLAMLCTTQTTVQTVAQDRTQALDDSAWSTSQWLSAKDAKVVTGQINDHENGQAADGASWFSTTVTNEGRVKKATWMTTALGTYDLYVNGRMVGDEVLKPGFTHPVKTRRSFTYDITPLLKRKAGQQNQLAAQVVPGWWADKIVTPWGHDGMLGHKCAFRAVLRLEYADGTTKDYGTDPALWQAGIAGPVTHAGIFDGEAYDARIAQGFATTEKLSVPEVNTEFQGEIVPSAGAEVYHRTDLALRPVEAYVYHQIENQREGEYGRVVIDREYKDGDLMRLSAGDTLVIDFGQNSAAVPQFVFQAAKGTVLSCRPGELLNDGNGARSRGMDGPEAAYTARTCVSPTRACAWTIPSPAPRATRRSPHAPPSSATASWPSPPRPMSPSVRFARCPSPR